MAKLINRLPHCDRPECNSLQLQPSMFGYTCPNCGASITFEEHAELLRKEADGYINATKSKSVRK